MDLRKTSRNAFTLGATHIDKCVDEQESQYKRGFTLAEVMIMLLLLSLITAAFLPIITTRSKASTGGADPWKYASNNSDIYFSTDPTPGAAIGVNSLGGANTRLLLNTNALGQNHIVFTSGGQRTGILTVDGNGNTGLGNVTFNSPLPTNATAIGTNATASANNSSTLGGGTASGDSSLSIGG